jgi:sucrose-6-phosphate hydrolase SacC (GH32 family)
MIGWMNNWQYAAKLPTNPWRGQMTIPRELSLRRTPDGIRVFQEPVANLTKLETSVKTRPETHSFRVQSEMHLGTARETGWRLLADDSHYTLVGYDRQNTKLFIDRTHSGLTNFSKDFPARVEAPLKLAGHVLRLDMLVDRCSVELFADGGRVTMTNLVFPPPGANGFGSFIKGAKAYEIQSIYEKAETEPRTK